ncbi:MAG: hypothetical protein HY929_03645 [Euryarchaeota archaeon]|nr:hypothetical protein [Euryarchaeota archaeon]
MEFGKIQSKAPGTYANTKTTGVRSAETTVLKPVFIASVQSNKPVVHGNEALPKQEKNAETIIQRSSLGMAIGIALTVVGIGMMALGPVGAVAGLWSVKTGVAMMGVGLGLTITSRYVEAVSAPFVRLGNELKNTTRKFKEAIKWII